ncbi:uncharacterized protein [Eurosta solidaginis]|uniref:uncharacterized protein n=1 Tax=Eurosta solidaginis TaxID=178769 RepID=UPI0035308AA2
MTRYNFRRRNLKGTSISKMSNSREESSSEDENERTMIANEAKLAELQQQIRKLQLSLEASEKERLCLKNTLASTTAASHADEAKLELLANSDATLASSMNACISTAANFAIPHIAHTSFFNACTSTAANFAIPHIPHTSFFSTPYCTNSNPITYVDTFSPRNHQTMPICAMNTNPQPDSSMETIATQVGHTIGNYSTPLLPNTKSIYVNSTGANHVPISSPIRNNAQTCIQPYSQPFMRKIQDLPQFSGLPEEWPMFAVAYKETTHLYSYTNVENLLRLQKALKGDARNKVESLLIHPSSVDAVMSSLEFHFGRPEVLIRSQLAKARLFPPITAGRINEIANFSSMVTNLVAFLENAGAVPHLTNPSLLDELVGKLPLYKREEWARHKFTINTPYPTIRDFSLWLQQVSLYIVMATEVNKLSDSPEQLTRKLNKSANTVLAISEENFKCLFCKDNHKLHQCQEFKDVDCEKRWEIVKANKLCFGCLYPGHSMYNCSRRRVCNISSCQKYHNKLLHNQTNQNATNGSSAITETPIATVSSCQSFRESSMSSKSGYGNIQNKTLLKFLPVKLHGPKGCIEVIAFIDEGAKVTLLEEEVANEIGVTGSNVWAPKPVDLGPHMVIPTTVTQREGHSQTQNCLLQLPK